jgi:hypothetical protein
LSLDEDGNISDAAINSISNQVVSRMRLGFPAGATIPLTAPGMWYSTSDNNFHVFDVDLYLLHYYLKSQLQH